jgi:hypothetical protein
MSGTRSSGFGVVAVAGTECAHAAAKEIAIAQKAARNFEAGAIDRSSEEGGELKILYN